MERDGANIRVLVADEQSLFREALRAALESQSSMDVVAEAQTGCQAAMEVKRTGPDVAVLSVTLPHCDGIEATLRIHQEIPDCRILVLAGEEDQKSLVEAIEAGATGYLSKDSPLLDLIEAVRVVHRGEMLVPPWMLGGLLATLIRRRREQRAALQRIATLTRRESEVLALLAQGTDYKGIARELVISPETARTHIKNVLIKLDLHSRPEAAAFVRRYDLLEDLVGAKTWTP